MSEIHTSRRTRVFTFGAVMVVASLASWSGSTAAQTAQQERAEERKESRLEAAGEIKEAADAFVNVMNTRGRAIPADVLSRAQAVAVFDNVYQAAFLVGGRGGDGVISRRRPNGWSAPAFFKMGGASVGPQIGGTKTDLVLLFMDQASLDALLDDRLEVGAEVKAVAGPASAGASASTTASDSGILVYARHEGLFAGAALEGAVITPDNDLNRATYAMTAREILTGSPVSSPIATRNAFTETLAKYAASKSS
jgi:lipid-binding SYLF domain-containing protein